MTSRILFSALFALVAVIIDGSAAFAASPEAAQLPPPLAISILPFLPEFKVRTLLIALHLLGLSAGLGSVLTLDVLLMKAVFRGKFHMRNANMIWILARTTSWGLGILWLSGLGFLALYLHDQPDLLSNPKIIAKVTVVTALTVNGWLIHHVCMPRFMEQIDQKPLVLMKPHLQLLMMFSGVLSAVSWYSATLLGVLKELNGKVPASTLIMMWGAFVAVGFVAILVVYRISLRLQKPKMEVSPLTTVAHPRMASPRPSKLKRPSVTQPLDDRWLQSA